MGVAPEGGGIPVDPGGAASPGDSREESPAHGRPPFPDRRNYPCEGEALWRAEAGRSLEFRLEFQGPASGLQVCIRNNFQGGEWTDHPLQAAGDGWFAGKISAPPPGVYRFRARMSVDGGRSWRPDSTPYVRLVVDPPGLRPLAVYTLVTPAAGNLADWLERLPAIRGMGFNGLLLLPLTRMGASRSPYSCADLFEVDPAYLPPGDGRPAAEQLAGFAATAGDAGLKLGIDLVLNHVAPDSRLAREHPEWIVADPGEADGFKRAGWWKGSEWMKWDDLVLLEYDHPEADVREALWETMAEYAEYWAGIAAGTGGFIRLDNFHSCNPRYLAHLIPRLRKKHSELPMLAELFEDHEVIRYRTGEFGLNLLLGTLWEEPYADRLRRYLEFIHGESGGLAYYTPITSHDSGTPAREYGSHLATVPRYAIAALMGMGATGIVQGVEYGSPEKLSFIGEPYKWRPAPGSPDYRDAIAAINRLLFSHKAFRAGGNLEFLDAGHPAALAVFRRGGARGDSDFLVLANLDTKKSQKIKLDLKTAGLSSEGLALRAALTGGAASIEGKLPAVTLEPCGLRVWEVVPTSGNQ